MATIFPAQTQSFIVSGSGQVIGDTQMTFTQMLTIGVNGATGAPLTMASLGTLCYMTIEPNTVNEEQIQFTGLTQNSNGTATITGVSNVGFLTPYTVTSGFLNTHAGGVSAIISNTSAFYAGFANVNDPETVTGLWTFSTSPIVPTPSTSGQAATKGYVDGIAIAGAPNASTTVKGIGLVSVAPVSATNPIFIGQNDPILPTQAQTNAAAGNNTDIAVGTGNKFVTQTGLQKSAETYGVTTGSANAYVLALSPIPTSYVAGMTIRFTTNFANTGTATVNVNSLGAKTLQINGVALASGQLANGATYTATYDGTNFQVESPVIFGGFSIGQKNGVATVPTSASTQTIAHGLGAIPKSVQLNATKLSDISGHGAAITSYGTYNGTNVATEGIEETSNSSTYVPAAFTDTTHAIYLQTYGGGGTPIGCQATIAVDATNITLTWTAPASGTYSTVNNGVFNWSVTA